MSRRDLRLFYLFRLLATSYPTAPIMFFFQQSRGLDFRADITAPDTFDRVLDTAIDANANRRRIDHRLDDHDEVGRHTGPLRQAVVAEFAIGLVIIGITAAMVVSPPSTSRTETGAPRDARVTSILHDVVLTPERPTR